MMLEACLVIGVVLNVVASTLVMRATIRNYTIHQENLSIAAKIGKAVELMRQLRDLLNDDLEDSLTVGDADKEGKHGIH